MPTLDWIGKKAVVNHHREVPFHILKEDESLSFGKRDSGNLIVEGDNLVALKALLPYYKGKVKCIYIDPPYNTGEEKWVYNDNVNSPEIKKWLGQVVGKEMEDLSRHDKWLCMMYPRLSLLKEFLSDDGVIYISIDDNEACRLKLLCDEIFGDDAFIAQIPWRKRTAKADVPFGISQDFESIFAYAKTSKFRAAIEGKERKYFETPDFPNRPWRIHDLTSQRTAEERPNSYFTIVNPKNGKKYPASELRTWALTAETFEKYYAENKIVFPDDYDFLNIQKPAFRYWKDDDIKKANGFFGLTSVSTNLPKEVGMTQDGTKEITELFGKKIFNFPKPSSLISYLIKIATYSNKDSLILDSFAGSGTTAQAVLELNKEDGGNRKFILCEMLPQVAEPITRERAKRVIERDGLQEQTGFKFAKLGEPIYSADGDINPNIKYADLARHVFFMATGTPLAYRKQEFKTPLVGISNGVAIYLLYNGILGDDSVNGGNRLTQKVLKSLPKHDGVKIIYGTACGLSESVLRKSNIVFRQIPYSIFERQV